MGALIKDLLGKGKGDSDDGSSNASSAAGGSLSEKISPFLNIIIIFFVIIGASGAYYQFHYIKVQKTIKTNSEEIARLNKLKTDTTQIEAKIAYLKSQLDSSKEQFLENLKHFGNSEDLGGLYQTISDLSLKYDLQVLNIEELPKKAPAPKPLNSKGKKTVKKKNATEVHEVRVTVELKGPYVQYIQFKEDLAVSEMMLKINEETVKVKKDETGKIYSKLTLTTYAIDMKPFEKIKQEVN